VEDVIRGHVAKGFVIAAVVLAEPGLDVEIEAIVVLE
jgi:hypothetical protein